MQIAQAMLRHIVLLAIVFTGIALAQPAPKTQAQTSALAALHAIDDYEASMEALLSHIRDANFTELKAKSDNEVKLHQAVVARDKVSDAALQKSVSFLLEEVTDFWMESSNLLFKPKDTTLSIAIANFHSDRALVETEIKTGQRGLLRAAVLKRLDKR